MADGSPRRRFKSDLDRITPSDLRGEPLVYDSAFKFAFDVLDLVSQLCNFQLGIRFRRPNFHHRIPNLMTPQLREMFRLQKDISDSLLFFHVILNLPPVHNRTQFVGVLDRVTPAYRNNAFNLQSFVEYCFLLAFWTLVIRERNYWKGAPEYAVEMITMVTRGVFNLGGFSACPRWPTEEDMRREETD